MAARRARRDRLGRRLPRPAARPGQRVRQEVRPDRRPPAVHRRPRRDHHRRRRAAVVLRRRARPRGARRRRDRHRHARSSGWQRFDVTWLGKLATFLLMFAIPGFMLGCERLPRPRRCSRSPSWILGIPGLVLSLDHRRSATSRRSAPASPPGGPRAVTARDGGAGRRVSIRLPPMNVPEQLRYSSDHEWVSRDGDVVRIGITDYAQDALGDVVFVQVPDGRRRPSTAGDTFGEVESTKSVSDVYAPVVGHRRRGQRGAGRRARRRSTRIRTATAGSARSG